MQFSFCILDGVFFLHRVFPPITMIVRSRRIFPHLTFPIIRSKRNLTSLVRVGRLCSPFAWLDFLQKCVELGTLLSVSFFDLPVPPRPAPHRSPSLLSQRVFSCLLVPSIRLCQRLFFFFRSPCQYLPLPPRTQVRNLSVGIFSSSSVWPKRSPLPTAVADSWPVPGDSLY